MPQPKPDAFIPLVTPQRNVARALAADLLAFSRRYIDIATVAILLLALVIVLQIRSNAYVAEFGIDEAAHYVSGLMVHDYLRDGMGSPVAFLRNFHSHYPLVGIGHW